MRLSQYIGDFIPEAQVKGVWGLSLIALICRSFWASWAADNIDNIQYLEKIRRKGFIIPS